MDYAATLSWIEELARQHGDYIAGHWEDAAVVDHHDSIDFSTQFDLELEQKIYAAISGRFPNHGFVGEEAQYDTDPNAEYIWYVDPIDGTKFFGKQVPLFTTAIGLSYRGEPVLGAVYNPISKQLYSGAQGVGSFINGRAVRISPTPPTQLIDMVLSIEVSYNRSPWVAQKLGEFVQSSGRVRLFGNGTLAVCWLLHEAIHGYVDLFGMKDHDKWQDLVAPLAIVANAGYEYREFVLPDGARKLICAHPDAIHLLSAVLAEPIGSSDGAA